MNPKIIFTWRIWRKKESVNVFFFLSLQIESRNSVMKRYWERWYSNGVFVKWQQVQSWPWTQSNILFLSHHRIRIVRQQCHFILWLLLFISVYRIFIRHDVCVRLNCSIENPLFAVLSCVSLCRSLKLLSLIKLICFFFHLRFQRALFSSVWVRNTRFIGEYFYLLSRTFFFARRNNKNINVMFDECVIKRWKIHSSDSITHPNAHNTQSHDRP